MFPNRLWAYRLTKVNVRPAGLTNKNAADALGERAFMFGFRNQKGGPDGGMARLEYNDGVVLKVPVSYTKTGMYAMCNENYPNHSYTCMGDSPYLGEESTAGGFWWSFPASGENIYWHQGDCPLEIVTLPAKVLVDKLAAGASCDCPKTGGDDSSEEAWKSCATCLVALSDSKYIEIWEKAFQDHGSLTTLNGHAAQILV